MRVPGSTYRIQFGPATTPFAHQPLQQIVQSLLVVPQQLQQLLAEKSRRINAA